MCCRVRWQRKATKASAGATTATFTAPAPDLTALRAAHWEDIKRERDKRIQTGGCQVAGKWFHSDTFRPHAADGPRHDGCRHSRRSAVENHGRLIW